MGVAARLSHDSCRRRNPHRPSLARLVRGTPVRTASRFFAMWMSAIAPSSTDAQSPATRPSATSVTAEPSATGVSIPAPLPFPAGERQSRLAGAAANSARESSELPLFADQALQPIDLAGALRLAGAQNPDIAFARKQVLEAVADLEQARALWLPSLFIGPTYYRVDGQVQNINGQVETVSRGSLSLGATAATANGFPAAAPGTGYPGLNGLSSVLRISDAIFEPLAAGRVAAASQAGLRATANDTLLSVSEAYFDLQLAAGSLAIAREAAANAESLSIIAREYSRTGQGLEADYRRALTEYQRRRREVRAVTGQVKIASANLVRPLLIDPHFVVAPVEPAETVVRLVPDETPLDLLMAEAVLRRPELAQAHETIKAAAYRLKQAKLRPFVPSLAVTYSGGGFGGGQDAFFGNFGARGDVAASLFWDVRNLYFTDRAIIHRRKAEREAADIDLVRVQARVVAEVVASCEARAAASGEMDEARKSVTEAIDSLRLNFANIRQGQILENNTRPIEVLQPIQALALARAEYLNAVLTYNRSQFRLYRALGNCPKLERPAPPADAGTRRPAPSLGPGERQR
jgi:outer membrane protein TolC